MPDRDGATCPTCLTLNPPAAPACVRCNTPLPAAAGATATLPLGTVPETGPDPAGSAPGTGPAAGTWPTGPAAGPGPAAGAGPLDPTLGSKGIGPGLAGGAAGAPGSSRAHAAAVQPPGYGLDDPPPPAAPEPEADTAVARRVTVAGLVLVGVVLAVGGGALWFTRPDYLDSRDVEAAVGAELSERGGAVTVSCPGDPRHRSGERFECVASDTTGGRRTLTVTVLDDSGRYRWALDP